MRSRPKVTIVMPVYNTPGAWLAEAVKSVETAKISWSELILVDDGSNNLETLQALDRLEAVGHRVLRTENQGVSAARNLGIGEARGEYILPLDSDDLLAPKFLPEAADLLDMTSEVDVVAGALESFGARTIRIVPDPETSLAQALLQSRVSATSLFRRSAWEEVGGFDETLRLGHEDAEFWIRLLVRGKRIVGLPLTAALYRTGHDSLTAQRAGIAAGATTNAIVRNNPEHLALLFAAAIKATDLQRPAVERARVMNDLWVRFEAIDRVAGRIPGLRWLGAQANAFLARSLAARSSRGGSE